MRVVVTSRATMHSAGAGIRSSKDRGVQVFADLTDVSVALILSKRNPIVALHPVPVELLRKVGPEDVPAFVGNLLQWPWE